MTFTYMQDFKDSLRFKKILDKHLKPFESLKARNSIFKIADAIEFMVDAVIQGYSRFMHMDQLRTDAAYESIRGTRLPSEKVCRDSLALLPEEEAAAALKAINKDILNKKALADGPREVMDDFDDTVVTVFGSQEGANVGFDNLHM